MKKIILFFTFSVVILVFTSCGRCQDCTKQGNTGGLNGTHTVCRGDFESAQDYQQYIEDLEANGEYECY